jgi:hypothetical protein
MAMIQKELDDAQFIERTPVSPRSIVRGLAEAQREWFEGYTARALDVLKRQDRVREYNEIENANRAYFSGNPIATTRIK